MIEKIDISGSNYKVEESFQKYECSNVFAGIDILEAKLTGQIRRYKIETNPHLRKNPLLRLFRREK